MFSIRTIIFVPKSDDFSSGNPGLLKCIPMVKLPNYTTLKYTSILLALLKNRIVSLVDKIVTMIQTSFQVYSISF